MRVDMTANFQAELSRQGRAPVQLLAFNFPTAGTVRVSDRDLGPADGLTDQWAGLVEDWGTLEDVLGDDPSQVTIEARQMSVTLFNRGATPFSDYFLTEDPEGITADLYQWFEGLSQADLFLIDRFAVADPISFGQRDRLLTLDLVSLVVNMDAVAGGLLAASDWPNALAADVGKAIALPFGNVGQVPSLCARTAPAASLAGSILADTLTIDAYEDLDALAFSAAGILQIGEEWIRYASRTASRFNVVQRGYLSTAADHLDRAELVELITDHTYILSRGPVQAIDNIKVGGYPAPAGIATADPAADPAVVVFSEKPYAYRYAAGSSFVELQFDAINADNSAYQAYKAYDAGDDATAARIDADHRVLSLKQVTENPDRGQIVKAYLAVEHWETDTILNDYAEVWVEGVGVVGRLSRPNAEEGIQIEAEVDIDHGHTHTIGGEHTHNFYDPILQTNETPHTHMTATEGYLTTIEAPAGFGSFALNAPYDPGVQGDIKYITFTGLPAGWSGGIVRFSCNVGGARLAVAGSFVASGEQAINLGVSYSTQTTYQILAIAYGNGVVYAQAAVWDLRLEVIQDTSIIQASTGANTQVAVSGTNANTTSDKKADDVHDLATDNVAVQVTTAQASTRSYVNVYDLTAQVQFDWSWFNDRDVKVTYTGDADAQRVYILHAFFDVEFRARERFFSDAVTAELAGLIDDDAGTYTGTPGALITRPDHVVKRLLLGPGGLPASAIDAASYAAAGARLAAKGYTIDGLIDGATSVKDALRAVAFQSRVRPIWSAGLSKLAFVEALEEWPAENPITAADVQQHSISVQRQAAAKIQNTVDLFFGRTWTNDDDGPAGFASSARGVNTASVARFGVRYDPAAFLFDLVVNDAMAADLAAFYARRFSTPSSYYYVNCYLPFIGLEKEDKVQLSADWNQLKKAKMRVLSASRIFGSGKNTAINRIALVLESLRYLVIAVNAADGVQVMDALAAELTQDGFYSEALHAVDTLAGALGVTAAEAVQVADAFSLVQVFDEQQAETITAADAVACGIGVAAADAVAILDDAEEWRVFGFGGGQYGIVGFGGWAVWHERSPDEVRVLDTLEVVQNAEDITDTVTAAEALAMSSGYGCPVGSGFGAAPWGA
jgi:hypothetical protein